MGKEKKNRKEPRRGKKGGNFSDQTTVAASCCLDKVSGKKEGQISSRGGARIHIKVGGRTDC